MTDIEYFKEILTETLPGCTDEIFVLYNLTLNRRIEKRGITWRMEDLIARLDQIMIDMNLIKPDRINEKTNKMEVVKYRQIYHYFCKILTPASLSIIGRRLGDRDHATVLNSFRRVNEGMETNREFRELVSDIEDRL